MLRNNLNTDILFLTNGDEVMRIKNNGNVGIGTTGPNDKLEVAGGIRVDDYIRARDSGGLALKTDDGTTRLYVKDNGNVGIGTTSPSQVLSVQGNVLADDYLTYSPLFAGDAVSQIQNIQCLDGTLEENGWCEVDHSTLPEELREGENFRKIDRSIQLNLRGIQQILTVIDLAKAPTTTSSLIIDSQGRFGIATTSPTNILTIAQGAGNAIADGWSVYSSKEYKTDIAYLEEDDYEEILDEIEGMDLARYRWKNEIASSSLPSYNKTMLGVIAEEAPAEVLSKDGRSVSLYDYASFALAGVKGVKSELDKLKNALGVIENEDGTLSVKENEVSEAVIIKGEGGQEYQLTLDNEGYVILDKVRVKELEIVSGGQMTVMSGENEITGEGEIVAGQRYGEVRNDKIKAGSKIFISFTSNLDGRNWWICEKKAGEYFRVCLSSPADTLTTFDYWIVQTKAKENEEESEEEGLISEESTISSGEATSTIDNTVTDNTATSTADSTVEDTADGTGVSGGSDGTATSTDSADLDIGGDASTITSETATSTLTTSDVVNDEAVSGEVTSGSFEGDNQVEENGQVATSTSSAAVLQETDN